MRLLLVSLLALAACDRAEAESAKAKAKAKAKPQPQQENPKKGLTADWKADLKLTLEQKDQEWIFVLEGTTNVPKEVSLRARIFAVEVVNDPVQGKREDEEPLVWEDEDGQPGFKIVEVTNGKLREEVYRFARKPWAIRYRGRLLYRPRDQSEEVLKKFGDDDWSLHADLRFGTEAAYGEDLKVRVKEIFDDLTQLQKLFGEIRKKFAEHRKQYDEAAWKAWKDPWYAAVEGINERNKMRFSLWTVWVERQAKMRVGGMCELLRRIAVLSTDQFAAAKPEFARIGEMIDGFHSYLEEAWDVIGLDGPLDVETVGPLLNDYEIAFAPLRAWIEKGQGEDVRRDARRECLASLFKIPPLLQNRKRAYKYVNEISVRFTRLLEASYAPASPEAAAAVKKSLEEHDEALRDFKRFAGLK